MHQPKHLEQLRHELRTCLNHIIGYGEILATDAMEYERDEYIPGLKSILKKAEKIRKLISFFFGDDTDLVEIATPEDIRKAFYVPLVQIIGDARRLLVQFQSQEPIFVRDMEQLIGVTNQMLDLVEAEIVDLQIEGAQAQVVKEAEPAPLSIDELPSFKDFEARVGDDLQGNRANIPGHILIVDDSRAMQTLLSRNLTALGHLTHTASSGPEALSFLQDNPIDIIILDVLMPGMTGYQVLRELKKTPILQDIPVIMVSSLDSSENIAQCIKLGAEDYLSKDFEPEILRARIDACMEKRHLQKQQQVYLQAIMTSQEALARELSDAAQYISDLLPQPISNEHIETAITFIPSAQLGGDFVGHFWIDHETLALYLIDVSGHGVKSALLSVSLSNTMDNQALPGTNFFDPGEVLTHLNTAYQQRAEANSFFTMWYATYNVRSRKLKYANGGSPPALIVSPSETDQTSVLQILSEKDILLGAQDDYLYKTHSTTLIPGSFLYVFSDGIYEMARSNGKLLGLKEFQRLLVLQNNTPKENLDEVVNQVRAMTMSDIFQDDVSLLSMKIIN